jgi:hypothetical protein
MLRHVVLNKEWVLLQIIVLKVSSYADVVRLFATMFICSLQILFMWIVFHEIQLDIIRLCALVLSHKHGRNQLFGVNVQLILINNSDDLLSVGIWSVITGNIFIVNLLPQLPVRVVISIFAHRYATIRTLTDERDKVVGVVELSCEFVCIKSRFSVLFVLGGLRMLFFWECSLFGHGTDSVSNSLSFEVRLVVVINVVLIAIITSTIDNVWVAHISLFNCIY